MRLFITIFLFISIFFQSLSAQEVTIKGTISNFGDSIKYVHLSSFNGFQVHKLSNNTFEFKIPGELPKEQVNHSFFVLCKNEYPTFDELHDELLNRKEITYERDALPIIVDNNNMIITLDAKEKKASVEDSELNKQLAEMNALREQQRVKYKEKEASLEEITEWGFNEKINALNKYPNSLLTVEYLGNFLTNPFMSTGFPELSPKHLEQIEELIAKVKEQDLSLNKINELQNLYDMVDHKNKLMTNIDFPSLKLSNLKNEKLNIKDLYKEADYIVIDVWATWCVPCLQQHPEYERIAGISKKNIKFIGLSIDLKEDVWKSHLAKEPKKYDNFWLDKSEVKVLEDSLSVQSYPTYMIINTKTGKLAKIRFPLDKLEELLATLE
ncbi:MAG: TlpA family protein disulfide reductase [Sphingobacterium mizutaii]|nr:TlpA family protein disulfide reductase [Sphingobacterium mizutaii]